MPLHARGVDLIALAKKRSAARVQEGPAAAAAAGKKLKAARPRRQPIAPPLQQREAQPAAKEQTKTTIHAGRPEPKNPRLTARASAHYIVAA